MKKISIRSLIIAAVLSVHVIFVSVLFFQSPFLPSKKQHKPILVKTIFPETSTIADKKASSYISRASTPPQASPSTPAVKKPTPSSLPKPPQPKAPMEKKLPEKKESPLPKKPVAEVKKNRNTQLTSPSSDLLPAISPSLLRELEESIAKIEDKSDKNRKAKNPDSKGKLSPPMVLQIDALNGLAQENTDKAEDYASLLAQCLHASLHLPDFGEVKIELTLKQDGRVAKLKVLKTESEQNKKYLESHLPQLKLPHLKGSFAKQDEHTFVLNFCNEL
jgi:outer membrane biosynthesis protein TonB